jgi:membrane-bound lytic murein transglycosylase F
MKKSLIIIITAAIILCGCDSNPEFKKSDKIAKPISRDLADLQTNGVLRVLVSYSSTSYFIYRGQPMGFEYELLKRLAKELDLELELVLVKNMDSVFHELNRGRADMIAHGMTITSDRKEKVDFTNYLYLTSQVLVQKKPDNWRTISWSKLQKHLLHDAIDLIGDTVSVRENSSYIKRIENLSEELGDAIYIDTLPGNLSTEKIIKKVVAGEIKYTVADKNLAQIHATYFPILDVKVPLSFSQRIAWAVRKNSPELLAAINQWIEKEKQESDYYVIYNRYFKNKRDFKRRIKSDFMSLNGNKISKYDEIIKKYSEQINWDWRMIASLIYQESRFKPKAKSWAGAKGLMQVMPNTAEELGITNRSDPEQSIKGGTRYLEILHERFDQIPDSIERIKFTMAAYNCGYHHVKDAQFLAGQNKLDSLVWTENVEKMVLALSDPDYYNKAGVKYGYVNGIEPVTYVDQIFKRYEHYVKFIEE